MKNSTFILIMAVPVAVMVILSNVNLDPAKLVPGAILILFMAGCAGALLLLEERRKKKVTPPGKREGL